MPWFQVRNVTIQPGEDILIEEVTISNQRFAVGFGSVAPNTRRKYGIIYCRGDNTYPDGTAATEIVSKPVWFNRTEFRPGPNLIGGFVRFRLSEDFGGSVQLLGFRFT